MQSELDLGARRPGLTRSRPTKVSAAHNWAERRGPKTAASATKWRGALTELIDVRLQDGDFLGGALWGRAAAAPPGGAGGLPPRLLMAPPGAAMQCLAQNASVRKAEADGRP
jgi:hypothetical protein